ncbi:oligo-1,6-glucosidase [Vallitalea longa]|uniref:Oligo-1,6-glucosidase n=1 Tax=Vallitalea longa TaxID=2936439 RepID=A0A9W5Y8K3_9FIRM|nr:alpha-glucosidase [Vallitalea longa]GKX29185.1 oligo-1,6-glucosidase [Vallitalea longa]
MFSKNSRLGEVMKNPLGVDIIEMLLGQMNINKLIVNNLIRQIKLKSLIRLSKGKIDDKFINMLIAKLNHYDNLLLPKQAEEIKPTWWKEAVAYQIYPRSFKDSNQDGIGDLCGIIEKLDYLQELGINLIWLSPIYDSPNDDNGYDIRDYKKIMQEFGTMQDFDRLLLETHKRGIRLIMDLVINHTSDEHKWFVESSKSKDNPYREYYIWEKGKNGKEPNNWTSFFSGPAWNYDYKTNEWSMHIWSKKQMDLNWNYKPMRNDLYEMINWWLDKGIDGFRLDVINFISKESQLPDGHTMIEELIGVCGVENYAFGPHVHSYLQELNKNTFSNYDVVTVGETPGLGLNTSKYFTHESREELNMIFNFEHMDNPGKDRFDDYQYDLNILKKQLVKWQMDYGNSCWNSLFLENHDFPRMISKITNESKYYGVVGKLLATLLLTLKGTPFIYQGQEIGMINAGFDLLEEYRDVESINMYDKLIKKGMTKEEALRRIKIGSRDNARVPMQWSSNNFAGFSDVNPWIGVSQNYKTINVKSQLKDNNSVYHFYKSLVEYRKGYKTLVYGDFIPYKLNKKNRFAYYRKDNESTFYIEINLCSAKQKRLKEIDPTKLLLSNYINHITDFLEPYEVDIYMLNNH